MRIKEKIVKFLFLILSVYLIFIPSFSVYAKENPAFADFTADAELPENQFTKDVTFFDLKIEAGKSQELIVKLKNTTSKKITITPSINRAQTNRAGVVTYSVKNKKKSDAALRYNIEDIVTIKEKKIEIEGYSEYQLKLLVKMPDQPFDGILAGGIYLLNNTSSTDDGNIKNYFAREIGLIIRSNDESKDLLGDLQLIDVSSDQENGRNVVSVLLENNQPAYLSGLKIKGTVTKEGSDEPTLTLDKEASMAPNSIFDLPISLNGKPFEAGKYTFKGTATQGDRTWDLEKEFEITAKEAKEYNQKDVSIKKKENIFDNLIVRILVITVVSLLLLFIISISLLMLKKRKEKIRREKARKRKKKNVKRKKKIN